ncbi:MAG: hypothetical protein Q9218_002135 [Villophora microphyllina]
MSPSSLFDTGFNTDSESSSSLDDMPREQLVECNGTPAEPSNGVSDGVEQASIKRGMISNVKNLYPGKADESGRSTWVETYPTDLEDPVENDQTARYALLVRNIKSYDGRKKLEIHSIVVQSPLLKKALGVILAGYPGITTSLDRLTFKPPFKPFVHRWAELVSALQDEDDPVTKSHLELFHRTLEQELRDDLQARDDYLLHKVITFDTCWMIFEPGTIVYVEDSDRKYALRLTEGSYLNAGSGTAFGLTCEKVDWDGEDFGLAHQSIYIYPFGGTCAITELEAYPLQYHDSLAQVKQELIKNGELFESLSGYQYKHYKGVAVAKGMWGQVKYNVDSRIIIDTYAWNRFNPNAEVSLRTLTDCRPSRPWPDYDDQEPTDPKGEGEKEQEEDALTSDQLLLCNTTVKGYSLKNKKWMTFAVDRVCDIKWNDTAFERLVLPEDHKELILALIESQIANKETFDDVIQGKGKGMIMLLSGPPGVGKTLTAESVAENIHAPLYMMSAGDLGLTSSEVESSLQNVLEMCTKWNAVLLIDEADVFLEARSAHDLERNKLVSIFLRMLEYYEGILFLTTNRVDNIDAAFQSRIHISMEYNELSVSSRHHVWCNFLSAGGTKTHGFSNTELDKLADYQMNGREIKNVLKTAQLLAGRKKEALAVSHVESVLAIEKRHVGEANKP